MLRKAMSVLALMTALAGGSSVADTLVVDGNSAAGNVAGHPGRGITKAGVVSGWGEPSSRDAPVGDPPISSWEYEPFIVYFEYDRVLHTVTKR